MKKGSGSDNNDESAADTAEGTWGVPDATDSNDSMGDSESSGTAGPEEGEGTVEQSTETEQTV